MWQDKVIAICQAFFVVAMLPTIFGSEKPPLSTSLMNTVLVAIITFTLSTLHLWMAVATGSAVGLCWLILTIQKLLPSHRS